MLQSPYGIVDTPALLVDVDRADRNIEQMQAKANAAGVRLRPHTKTHKMPYFAKRQVAAGASGICVAKVGEAEVMADAGIDDIFIAAQVVGASKARRIRDLADRGVSVIVAVDNMEQARQLDDAFSGAAPVQVRIEVEVGENRSGVLTAGQAVALAAEIKTLPHVVPTGIFCHEGHTYRASSLDECRAFAEEAQRRMLDVADALRRAGVDLKDVSIGATPSMLTSSILPGITEIRPGTYIFMDAAQAAVVGDFDRCAATVLATVTSTPTPERVILDAGAKALTAQTRSGGICDTPGLGLIKNGGGVRLSGVFDEHGIILDRALRDGVRIGDKLEIIPNHICPAVNLYDRAHLVSNGRVLEIVPVAARGKTR